LLRTESMSCQYIIKYFDCFIENSFIFIVSELIVSGSNLFNLYKYLVSQNQILEEKIIFEWFFQMIKGLAFLHSKLIIHLNLKPK
jgi:serine/threonine protein kinase